PPYTGGVPPCPGIDTVNISVNNPFEFDVDVECVKCHGDSTGVVTISNITGGSGAYQIQLVGGLNPSYDAGNDDLWWPVDTLGAPDYVSTDIVFDTLAAGDYWIYLRDDSGFTLANCCRPIKFTMCEPDSLELLTVMLVNDVECAGDSTGAFSIQADFGTPPYQYTYTRTELSNIGFPYPTLPDNPMWQSDSIISNLPSGLYVGWVMDANGCITGCEIDAQGAPIDDHRVAIREAGAIEFDYYNVYEPACFGGLADMQIVNVTGGSGDSITFKATGATYMGMDTVYVFAPMLRVDGGTYLLQNVLASNNDGYVISAMTSASCEATGDTVYVAQPDEFTVSIDITSGAICEGDR
ncbi:MAG: hypothetical protein KAH25_13135, partial [Bacteroidales bacterium]|nr:hypothetical protein [Bacteroidales bacterium]